MGNMPMGNAGMMGAPMGMGMGGMFKVAPNSMSKTFVQRVLAPILLGFVAIEPPPFVEGT